jgi:hypothetical protein
MATNFWFAPSRTANIKLHTLPLQREEGLADGVAEIDTIQAGGES